MREDHLNYPLLVSLYSEEFEPHYLSNQKEIFLLFHRQKIEFDDRCLQIFYNLSTDNGSQRRLYLYLVVGMQEVSQAYSTEKELVLAVALDHSVDTINYGLVAQTLVLLTGRLPLQRPINRNRHIWRSGIFGRISILVNKDSAKLLPVCFHMQRNLVLSEFFWYIQKLDQIPAHC